jgi:predicted nucleic acid-binding protein
MHFLQQHLKRLGRNLPKGSSLISTSTSDYRVRSVTYFADTSFWIALLDKREKEAHSAAHILKKRIGDDIVTSDLVLIELLAWFAKEGEHLRRLACNLVKALQTGPVTVVAYSDELFQRAFDQYGRVSNDKEWSLVDCASFLIMRDRNITLALTLDAHFKQAGFTIETQ